MTPEEAAAAITGVMDDGGICTPNSGMGRSRQIAQAIREAVLAERERCAVVADEMRRKYGSPTGDAYSNGMWDQGVRIAQQIRWLKD